MSIWSSNNDGTLSKAWPQNLAAFFTFLFLTIIAAWRVITNLNGIIVGFDNDIYINLWADWWTHRALTSSEISLWWTDLIFHPQGADLVYHSFSHLNTLTSLALRPWLGDLPAYNVTILLNFVFIGFSMFQLARYLTGSTTAALIAGIVFAFNSNSLYQSSHPVLLSIWCFPWLTLAFLRAMRENSRSWAIGAAFFVFLGATTSTILVILMVMWLLLLLSYLWFTEKEIRSSWPLLLIFGLLSGAAVTIINWPLLSDALFVGNSSFITSPRQSILTDMESIFIPNWHRWRVRGMYLGIVPVILALILATHQRFRRPARIWVWCTVLAYLFAIGPYPKVFGASLGITLPWSLPVSTILRNMYRMMILMAFGWSMVSAYGWLALADRLQKRPQFVWAAGLLAAAAIFIEFTAAPFPARSADVPEFYRSGLSEVPDNVALAILPTGRQHDKFYMYYQTVHQHPLTGGVISRAAPETMAFLYDIPMMAYPLANDSRADFSVTDITAQLDRLAEADVGYLIIDKERANNGLITMWRDWLTINPFYEDEDLIVYRTTLEAGRDFVVQIPLTTELGLIRADVAHTEAVQDGAVKIDMRWGSTVSPEENLDLCLQLYPAERSFAEVDSPAFEQCNPITPDRPTALWDDNEVVRDTQILWLDQPIPAGDYRLTAVLHDGSNFVGEAAAFSQISVHSADPQIAVDWQWEEEISLLGYDVSQSDTALDLTLYWQGINVVDRSYKVFVHLVDESTGTIIAQHDGVPRSWSYRTNFWEVGEVVRDPIQLPLTLDRLNGGQYTIYVGLYDEISGERLTAVSATQGDPVERVPLVKANE